MNATVTAEREVRSLPTLDKATYEAEAAAWASEQTANATPEDVLRLYRREELAAEKALDARNAAVHTLVTSYRLRRGADLAGAIGTGRSGLQKVKARVAASNPAPVPDADKVLPKLARTAMRHVCRRDALIDARDAAVQTLVDQGMPIKDVAAMIGRDRSRVSHIKHRDTAEVA